MKNYFIFMRSTETVIRLVITDAYFSEHPMRSESRTLLVFFERIGRRCRWLLQWRHQAGSLLAQSQPITRKINLHVTG